MTEQHTPQPVLTFEIERDASQNSKRDFDLTSDDTERALSIKLTV